FLNSKIIMFFNNGLSRSGITLYSFLMSFVPINIDVNYFSNISFLYSKTTAVAVVFTFIQGYERDTSPSKEELSEIFHELHHF
ncbi:hypothetical protein KNV96_14745, partial [Chryseobacterium indologenes]|uniref:hypothetical protein n=1 Tax=Chryseobacterium indologenes TaxID=253 RepID=UPI001C0987F3